MSSPLNAVVNTLHLPPKTIQNTYGLSLRTFLASLVTSASVFALQISLFVFLKDKVKHV